MSNFTSSAFAMTTFVSFVPTSVDPPGLAKTDAASVHAILGQYDQYAVKVKQRARQFLSSGTVSSQAVRPGNLKSCVGPDYLQSAIKHALIQNLMSVKKHTCQTYVGFLRIKNKIE